MLRVQSAKEMMHECHASCHDSRKFYKIATEKFVGETMMTWSTNKTHKVDDIDYNKIPASTFRKEYFKKRYETPLNDLKKPLLALKQKIIKKGMVGPILLLPEFYLISGLLDEIRPYLPIIKDLSQHTQISSTGRAQELESFMNDLQTNLETQKGMSQFYSYQSFALFQVCWMRKTLILP